jgi:hypothetical protein
MAIQVSGDRRGSMPFEAQIPWIVTMVVLVVFFFWQTTKH